MLGLTAHCLKDCMPVEVTQLAKFLNGTFVIPWHFIGLLVNIATEALHEKDSSPCIFLHTLWH